MDSINYEKYLRGMLIRKLEPNSVSVVDNETYKLKNPDIQREKRIR
jgi:hypothetical protein